MTSAYKRSAPRSEAVLITPRPGPVLDSPGVQAFSFAGSQTQVTKGEALASRNYGIHSISGASAGTYSGCRGCPSFVTPSA